ncbi:hypothetical protein KEM54_006734 [Ascosphaera aggregata]|nr:hypothetical protein KEM54_006734 [Ascosphaera aggregata]
MKNGSQLKKQSVSTRRHMLLPMSLMIAMLSGMVAAQDDRGHGRRLYAHGLNHWSGSGNIDAILEARNALYNHADFHMPARRADDGDNDDGDRDQDGNKDKDKDKDVDKDKDEDKEKDRDGDKNKDKDVAKHDDTKDQQDDNNNADKEDHNDDRKDDNGKDDKDEHRNGEDKDNNNKGQSHEKDQTTESHLTQTGDADQTMTTVTAASKTTDPPRTTDVPETTKINDKQTTEAPQTTSTESASATKTTSRVKVTVSKVSHSDIATLTLPTLYPGGITGLPSPQVPSTADAPYRQVSKYPEGFIFILVGSIIGFAFLGVLAWRGLIAWSINRSVRRTTGSSAKSTTISPASGTGEYETDPMVLRFGKLKGQGRDLKVNKTRRRGSAASSDLLGTAYTDVPMKSPMVETRPTRSESPFPSAAAPASLGYQRNGSSLFFSPTANPTVPISGPAQSQRRNQSGTYLPAGYYPTSPSYSNSRSRLSSSPSFIPHSRRGSVSQFMPAPQQHLPLSAHHLHRLNTMSQDHHQLPPQSYTRQPSGSDGGRHPPVSYMRSYSSSSLAPRVPARPPSSMLDDLLGSGVSVDGSGPDPRGEPYSGYNGSEGDRGGKGHKNGVR